MLVWEEYEKLKEEIKLETEVDCYIFLEKNPI